MKRHLFSAVVMAVLAGGQAMAACPMAKPAPDNLFDALKSSESEEAAAPFVRQIWDQWFVAPDERAQDLLIRGTLSMRQSDFDAAEETLSELTEYCPDYAEGWNQRAFARYLAGRFDRALEDIDRALELEPRHFGALAGRGLTLLRQGRVTLAHQPRSLPRRTPERSARMAAASLTALSPISNFLSDRTVMSNCGRSGQMARRWRWVNSGLG